VVPYLYRQVLKIKIKIIVVLIYRIHRNEKNNIHKFSYMFYKIRLVFNFNQR
jgi:hypothetical protein